MSLNECLMFDCLQALAGEGGYCWWRPPTPVVDDVVGDIVYLSSSTSTSSKVDDDANAVAQQFTNGRGSGDDVGSRDLGDGIPARLKAAGHTAGGPYALEDSRAPIR